MAKPVSSSVFAETYNHMLNSALNSSEKLGAVLDEASLATPFTPRAGEDSITAQFKQVSRVINSRDKLNTERDVFFVNIGGFDTHSEVLETLQNKFEQIDHALAAFEAEMVKQNLWDNVVVMSASDFGRTLRSNGKGTDHAWGGNSFIIGGALAGKQIHGHFPPRLDEESPLNVRRGGRLIPQTSWEAVWHGLADWFGVSPDQMDAVLPNLKNFPPKDLLTRKQLFQ